MSYDFPNSPTIGQIVTGATGLSYRWDGAKWNAAAPSAGGGSGGGSGTAGVASFNTRTGAVTLIPTDVTAVADTIYAPIASPTFTGTPSMPTGAFGVTQAAADSSTKLATTGYVKAQGYALLASPVFTGDPQAPTPATADNDTSIATTAYVKAQGYAPSASVPPASALTPVVDGTATPGVSATYARGDHVHPTDTSRAPLASPVFTGNPTAPTPPVGDADTSIATTAFVAASQPQNVGRNKLHNPLFNVAQRGAGPFGVSGFTVDRWSVQAVLDNISGAQIALIDADRTQLGDEEAAFQFVVAVAGNVGSTAFTLYRQGIENVRRLAGKTVTFSFYAAAQTGAPKIGVSLDQVFGTGGSPSASVISNATAVTLSTTWTRYTVSAAIPSVVGKTMGTNGDNCSYLNLWMSAGSANATRAGNIGVQSNTFALWGLQLEIGSVATPLEKPDPQQDLAKCQRFYQNGGVVGTSWQSAGSSFQVATTFATTMRAVPTITLAGTSLINLPSISANAGADRVVMSGLATASAPTSINTSFTASADL